MIKIIRYRAHGTNDSHLNDGSTQVVRLPGTGIGFSSRGLAADGRKSANVIRSTVYFGEQALTTGIKIILGKNVYLEPGLCLQLTK